MLRLGQGTFTHNTAGVPTIVACAKADLIDHNTDLVGAVVFGTGMVKGKGGESVECTAAHDCVKWVWGLIFTHLVSHSHGVADGVNFCYMTLDPM